MYVAIDYLVLTRKDVLGRDEVGTAELVLHTGQN